MNTFVKRAYDAGVQQAMVDFGLTKEANVADKARRLQSLLSRSEMPGLRKQLSEAQSGSFNPIQGDAAWTARLEELAAGRAGAAEEALALELLKSRLAQGGAGALGAGALGGAGYGAHEALRDPTMLEQLGLG